MFCQYYAQDRNLKQIVLIARVKPFKFKKDKTVVTVALTSSGKTVNLTNSRKSVVPTITCTSNATIKFGTLTFNLKAGTCKILDIYLKEGNNTLTVSGSGSVTFEYQEAEL